MSHYRLLLATAALMVAAAAPAATADPGLAKGDTRPYAGASVTVEKGVRVYRPRSIDDPKVITPGKRTPASFTLNRSGERGFSIGTNSGNGSLTGNSFGTGGNGFASGGNFNGGSNGRSYGFGYGFGPIGQLRNGVKPGSTIGRRVAVRQFRKPGKHR